MDVRTQPLIAQQGNIRVDPFAQAPVTQLPPSMARTLGGVGGSGQDASADQIDPSKIDPSMFEINAEELGHLQDAAANGDKESWDLLNALKLPLGVAAGATALYGAARGGASLIDAVGKAKGLEMVPSGRTGGVHAAPEPQKLLPNPTKAITDQTGSRFNQSGPEALKQLSDHRTIYEKTGGKLPTGVAAGDALRAAARAAMRR